MDNTELDLGLWKSRADGIGEAFEPIHASDEVAGIDLIDENDTHASAGISTIIGSELIGVIMKRVFFIRSSISNAVGVTNSFVNQAVN